MKIICVSGNYEEHSKILKNENSIEPILSIKPDTAVLKSSDFYIPEFSNYIQYEIELVVKISKGGKYIQKKNAEKHFEKIGLGIDFTALDLQRELKKKGLPWEKAKGFDNSAIISDFFPVKDYNYQEINFKLIKNNQVVQIGNSKNMIFGINELIAYISKFFTLRVGDLIFTGAPTGIGLVKEEDLLDAYLENQKVLSIKVH